MSAPVDMLAIALARLRPELEGIIPPNDCARAFWSMAKAARDYAAPDVGEGAFMALARESGVLRNYGRHAEEDVRHILNWAMRGMNPFATGPLK